MKKWLVNAKRMFGTILLFSMTLSINAHLLDLPQALALGGRIAALSGKGKDATLIKAIEDGIKHYHAANGGKDIDSFAVRTLAQKRLGTDPTCFNSVDEKRVATNKAFNIFLVTATADELLEKINEFGTPAYAKYFASIRQPGDFASLVTTFVNGTQTLPDFSLKLTDPKSVSDLRKAIATVKTFDGQNGQILEALLHTQLQQLAPRKTTAALPARSAVGLSSHSSRQTSASLAGQQATNLATAPTRSAAGKAGATALLTAASAPKAATRFSTAHPIPATQPSPKLHEDKELQVFVSNKAIIEQYIINLQKNPHLYDARRITEFRDALNAMETSKYDSARTISTLRNSLQGAVASATLALKQETHAPDNDSGPDEDEVDDDLAAGIAASLQQRSGKDYDKHAAPTAGGSAANTYAYSAESAMGTTARPAPSATAAAAAAAALSGMQTDKEKLHQHYRATAASGAVHKTTPVGSKTPPAPQEKEYMWPPLDRSAIPPVAPQRPNVPATVSAKHSNADGEVCIHLSDNPKLKYVNNYLSAPELIDQASYFRKSEEADSLVINGTLTITMEHNGESVSFVPVTTYKKDSYARICEQKFYLSIHSRQDPTQASLSRNTLLDPAAWRSIIPQPEITGHEKTDAQREIERWTQQTAQTQKLIANMHASNANVAQAGLALQNTPCENLQFGRLNAYQHAYLSSLETEEEWIEFLNNLPHYNSPFYLYDFYQFPVFRALVEKQEGYATAIAQINQNLKDNTLVKVPGKATLKTFAAHIADLDYGWQDSWGDWFGRRTPGIDVLYIMTTKPSLGSHFRQQAAILKIAPAGKVDKELQKAQAIIQDLRVKRSTQLARLHKETDNELQAARNSINLCNEAVAHHGGAEKCPQRLKNKLEELTHAEKKVEARKKASDKAKQEDYKVEKVHFLPLFGPTYLHSKTRNIFAEYGLKEHDYRTIIGDAIQVNQCTQLINTLNRAQRIKHPTHPLMRQVMAEIAGQAQASMSSLRQGFETPPYDHIDACDDLLTYAGRVDQNSLDYQKQFIEQAHSYAEYSKTLQARNKEINETLSKNEKELDASGCRKACGSTCQSKMAHGALRNLIEERDRNASRLKAIDDTYNSANPHAITTQTYIVNPAVQRLVGSWLEAYNPRTCTGNALQHQAHEEMLDLLDKISILHLTAEHALSPIINDPQQLEAISGSLARLIRASYVFASTGNIFMAWEISDATFAHYRYANEMFNGFKNILPRLIQNAHETGESVAALLKGVQNLFSVALNSIRHPIDTTNAIALCAWRMMHPPSPPVYNGDMTAMYAELAKVNHPVIIDEIETRLKESYTGAPDPLLEMQLINFIHLHQHGEDLRAYSDLMGQAMLSLFSGDLFHRIEELRTTMNSPKVIGRAVEELGVLVGSDLILGKAIRIITRVAEWIKDIKILPRIAVGVQEAREAGRVRIGIITGRMQRIIDAANTNITALIKLGKISLEGFPIEYGNLARLEEAIERFIGLPGCQNINGPIRKYLRFATSNNVGDQANAFGAAFELLRALELEEKGHKILQFGRKIGDVLSFDIVTETLLIECKKRNWGKILIKPNEDFCMNLIAKAKFALSEGKIFEVHSVNITENWKAWFTENGIKFVEEVL